MFLLKTFTSLPGIKRPSKPSYAVVIVALFEKWKKKPEILRFPSDDGFLFNQIWGKTLRDGTSNVFGIRRHPNPAICPVTAVETYVTICDELAIDLS